MIVHSNVDSVSGRVLKKEGRESEGQDGRNLDASERRRGDGRVERTARTRREVESTRASREVGMNMSSCLSGRERRGKVVDEGEKVSGRAFVLRERERKRCEETALGFDADSSLTGSCIFRPG